MAKVKHPFYSGDAWGKWANGVIFHRGGVVRKYFRPRNPATAAQRAQREIFKGFSMAGITKEQADAWYAQINHNHDGRYPLIEHFHDDRYSQLGHVHDHGDLTGLGDDDHSQYFNQARGDARYSLVSHTHATLDKWSEVVKVGDQDVTDSAVMVWMNELWVPMAAGVWLVELFLMYSGNSPTGDMKVDFFLDTAVMWGVLTYAGDNNTADAVIASLGVRFANVGNTAAVPIGCDAVDTVRVFNAKAMFRSSAQAIFHVRFAQNTAVSNTHARVKADSVLRYRRLA